ncbi:hypothetical protein RHP75_19345 [Pseudomonas sp. SG20056]|uniref:hypothetical protein n=1 Tax=Pseudomonas sp. SG20056 TaxID=3074146 RepID=UPI00287FBABE|nr:hypothetical protein [Pseudomonas sp. SG20056]WNF46505.1 hypothetical protein RHP75_19345 [Pseudomonas sp. SG20056]
MRELSLVDLEVVSGGADWGEVGAGLASVALSVAIVSTPVGLVGLGAAGALAYTGGVAIGDGLIEGDAFKDGTNYDGTNCDGTNYN